MELIISELQSAENNEIRSVELCLMTCVMQLICKGSKRTFS